MPHEERCVAGVVTRGFGLHYGVMYAGNRVKWSSGIIAFNTWVIAYDHKTCADPVRHGATLRPHLSWRGFEGEQRWWGYREGRRGVGGGLWGKRRRLVSFPPTNGGILVLLFNNKLDFTSFKFSAHTAAHFLSTHFFPFNPHVPTSFPQKKKRKKKKSPFVLSINCASSFPPPSHLQPYSYSRRLTFLVILSLNDLDMTVGNLLCHLIAVARILRDQI